jgi:PKD repeat protein
MKRALCLMSLVIAGCGGGGASSDTDASADMNIGDLGATFDGPGPLRATFTVVGCATLDTSTGEPRCSGRAPLTLTFVPLGAGLSAYAWTFMGGTPATAKQMSPTATFATPGTYTVTLAAGGTAGTTTATGMIVVSAGTTGSPCLADTDCDAGAGLFCVCKPGEAGCVGALSVGFCSRDCSGALCDAGQICADFTRGGAFVPASVDGGGDDDGGSSGSGGSGDVWRRALCVPSCTAASDCASGLDCRSLPALTNGAVAGGSFTWLEGCFAAVGGDDGDSCASATGAPDDSRCLSGRCDPYGARGLCTSGCTTSADCPTTAACATYNAPALAATKQSCLRRCDTTTFACDGDPLLGCAKVIATGGLSFTTTPAEDANTKYCAPLACSPTAMAPPDCTPSGSCTAVAGGDYCLAD